MQRAPAGIHFLAAYLLASSLVCGCTPMRSHLEPYRSDPSAASQLAERARAICECLRGTQRLPRHAFTTDGCSMSPDGNWVGCCVEHDIAYWCGGSAQDRRDADGELARCVVEVRHSQSLARSMRSVVRAGGPPCAPFPWRWGYGTPGLHFYETRTNDATEAKCFGAHRAPVAR